MALFSRVTTMYTGVYYFPGHSVVMVTLQTLQTEIAVYDTYYRGLSRYLA